ncbi:MAG: hypothetical protein ACREOA_11345, partial [Candidatus Dormibacteria bacterium]
HQHLLTSGVQDDRIRRRVRDEVVELVGAQAANFARRLLQEPGSDLLRGESGVADPDQLAALVLRRLAEQGSKMEVADRGPAELERRSD